ncbi:family 20 glycosylhydrolase [Rufibacter psychrotolerans]|uniref:family 20 glycosylhydrolase n=1 Tax=Rufibacter psychrotolerans TaxID=2812556 RepID=UPI00196716F6|nr:family 20 glycosylhydrolase [Rufibacter sp. SYSU D00308]
MRIPHPLVTRIASVFLLVFFFTTTTWAQQLDARKLALSWEVLQTNYQGKNQILAALTITNQAAQPLPTTGWKIYFNSGRQASEVKGNVTINFLNGDLNVLAPATGFTALAPGAALKIEYVANGKALMRSDVPSGFYLVWDHAPNQGVALPLVTVNPLSPENLDGHITPQDIFAKNALIQPVQEQDLAPVFPSPVSYQKSSGKFLLTGNVTIYAAQDFTQEAQHLAQEISTVLGKKPSLKTGTGSKGIILKKAEGLGQGGYLLQVTPAAVTISATEPAGIFYGIQSLKTMWPPQAWAKKQKSISIAAVEVSDTPRFSYRAFMLDVARNFQPKDQVKKVLDLMALYKLNVLHFHLNDDEGWRLEIPSLPELTQVGAQRAHSLDSKTFLPASYGSGPDASSPLGTGFYTKADFIELLKYAKDRHIRVIPEVETPGHARAAVKAMDARYERFMKAGQKDLAQQYLLRDLNDSSAYRSVQKWNDNVMNVALPSTYAFIEKVIDEIREMYQEAGAPLQTIHLGGDEVPAGVWEKSPAVAALMKKHPEIKSVDDVWYYYFGKVNQILKARNLYLSGWEEVAMRKTKLDGKTRYVPNPTFANENFHAYVWNNVWGWGNEDLAYRLANAGYKTILAPATNFYLDMAYQKGFDEHGTYWASISDLDAPFNLIPFDYYRNARNSDDKPVNPSVFKGKERLTDFGKANIVGLQALVWSETVRSKEQLESLLAPRILAFAERAWAKEPAWAMEKDSTQAGALYRTAWSQFVHTLAKRELPRLDHYARGFHYRIPAAGATVKDGAVHVNSQLPGFRVYYTTNGTEPTLKSKLYTAPIREKGTLKLRVFNAAGRGGNTVSIQHQ